MIKNNLMFYIKTTETCNLDCSHCFTSGKNGKKIFFNPEKVANWVNEIKEYRPESSAFFEFHGGEPFLADIKDMWKFYELTKEVWKDCSYGATTNLVYKLTEDKLDFMDKVLQKRIGTSWDPKIRFSNDKQRQLFEDNVKFLIARGYTIKLFVSLTRDAIGMEPIEIIKYAKSLGVQELDFERVTSNGYARKNLFVFPRNTELQNWFVKLHDQVKEHGARDWLDLGFLENVYSKFETGFIGGGTFCRDCEQKLFTINADGGISGCPNAAPEEVYGHINNSAKEVINAPKRCQIIVKELSRDTRCYQCPVYKYCGGDCHQLEWEGDVCPAPKLLMIKLDKEINGRIN
jgi:radical SAM protein with 4Fe4S-binding SPASM domain